MKTEKIKKMIDLVSFTLGIILASIGAIILLNIILKNYIFGINSERYYSDKFSQCEQYNTEILFSTNIDKELKSKIQNLSKIEKEKYQTKYEKCLVEEKKERKEIYQENLKRNAADGIAFLIVGLIILFFYRRQK